MKIDASGAVRLGPVSYIYGIYTEIGCFRQLLSTEVKILTWFPDVSGYCRTFFRKFFDFFLGDCFFSTFRLFDFWDSKWDLSHFELFLATTCQGCMCEFWSVLHLQCDPGAIFCLFDHFPAQNRVSDPHFGLVKNREIVKITLKITVEWATSITLWGGAKRRRNIVITRRG